MQIISMLSMLIALFLAKMMLFLTLDPFGMEHPLYLKNNVIDVLIIVLNAHILNIIAYLKHAHDVMMV